MEDIFSWYTILDCDFFQDFVPVISLLSCLHNFVIWSLLYFFIFMEIQCNFCFIFWSSSSRFSFIFAFQLFKCDVLMMCMNMYYNHFLYPSLSFSFLGLYFNIFVWCWKIIKISSHVLHFYMVLSQTFCLYHCIFSHCINTTDFLNYSFFHNETPLNRRHVK